jgi:two-component system response regulator NreC
MTDSEQIKIVIVDDHQIVRDGIKSMLEDQTDILICGEAGHGDELLNFLSGHSAEVILMDISMPGRSGIELTAEIRHLYPDIKVLMLSMYMDQEVIIRAVRNGAMGYLEKNTTKKELISAIHALARGEEYYSDEVSRIIVRHTLRKSREEEPKGLQDISKRELEILKLLAEGLTNQQIGEKLFISTRTVESHKTHVMQKLGLKTNIDLFRFLTRQGFLEV